MEKETVLIKIVKVYEGSELKKIEKKIVGLEITAQKIPECTMKKHYTKNGIAGKRNFYLVDTETIGLVAEEKFKKSIQRFNSEMSQGKGTKKVIMFRSGEVNEIAQIQHFYPCFYQ